MHSAWSYARQQPAGACYQKVKKRRVLLPAAPRMHPAHPVPSPCHPFRMYQVNYPRVAALIAGTDDLGWAFLGDPKNNEASIVDEVDSLVRRLQVILTYM